jgi:hypothetical protein
VFLFGLPITVSLAATALWAAGIGRGTGSLAPTTLDGALAWAVVIVVFVGWPAILITSVAMPWLSPRLKDHNAWLGASAAVCAVVTLVSAMVMALGDITEMLAHAWIFLLCGAGAGLTCALLTLKFRPHHDEPLP